MRPTLRHLLYGYASLNLPSQDLKQTLMHTDNGVSPMLLHNFMLSLLDNGHFHAYPPSPDFQKRWWKWAIGTLEGIMSHEGEGSLEEIDDRIYEHYVSLLTSSGRSDADALCGPGPPLPSYIQYPLNDASSVTLLESRTTIESGTTGLRTWQASLVLADFLLEHSSLLLHKRVLELGSGAGLLGAVVALVHLAGHGVSAIHLTDVNVEVLQRCKINIQLPCNQSADHPDVHFHLLDWFDALSSEDGFARSQLLSNLQSIDADIILGADIVYDPSIISALVATLVLALVDSQYEHHWHGSRERKQAYIALTVRNEETFCMFMTAAHKQLNVKEVPWDRNPLLQREGVVTPEGVVKILRMVSW